MDTSHKKHTKKVILATFAVGAAGVLGYFGWQLYKKKQQQKRDSRAGTTSDLDSLLKSSANAATDTVPDLPAAQLPALQTTRFRPRISAPPSVSSSDNSDFPLKKGSKGEKVRQLQAALIAKYGKSILPKYGVDGGFGSETAAALKKKGLPTTITESLFNVLTQSVQADGTALGKELIKATDNKDFPAALAALKKMSSTADYSAANSVYKTYYINGVHKTIVNGLLDTFSSDEEKQQIKFEFLRIGLQFNGSKWSLSGLGGFPIITIRPAAIWINARRRVSVPARVVLGNEVSRRLDYTLFENQGKYFLVPTRCVRYM